MVSIRISLGIIRKATESAHFRKVEGVGCIFAASHGGGSQHLLE